MFCFAVECERTFNHTADWATHGFSCCTEMTWPELIFFQQEFMKCLYFKLMFGTKSTFSAALFNMLIFQRCHLSSYVCTFHINERCNLEGEKSHAVSQVLLSRNMTNQLLFWVTTSETSYTLTYKVFLNNYMLLKFKKMLCIDRKMC